MIAGTSVVNATSNSNDTIITFKNAETGATDHEPLLDDVTGFERSVRGVCRPQTLSDLRQLVTKLYSTKTPMHVVSTGMNWGYGSALPASDHAEIVSLERLNQIRKIEIRADHAFAVIEPGVTQGLLAKHLDTCHPAWLINSTGSSPNTSVLGNCLDRGIGYFGLRSEDVLSLQLLMPNGDVVWTTRPGPDEAGFPFRSGPDLTEISMQSSGCIVVAGAIRLHRKHTVHATIAIALHNDVAIASAVDRLRTCTGMLKSTGVAHWGNRARARATLRGALSDGLLQSGKQIHQRDIHAFIERQIGAPWVCVLPVFGTTQDVQSTLTTVRSEFKHIAKIRLVTRKRLNLIKRGLTLFPFLPNARLFEALIDATSQLHGLAEGRPTNLPTEQAFSSKDGSRTGLFYFAPVLHGDSNDMGSALRAIEKTYDSNGFSVQITLNAVPQLGVVAITNATYNRDDFQARTSALSCLNELYLVAQQYGLMLYRRDIDHMSAIPSTRHQLVSNVVRAIDPLGLISPGRYCEVGA
jgi:4-cresol dehydrogenase (hydroxylating) flavoprotein subunit